MAAVASSPVILRRIPSDLTRDASPAGLWGSKISLWFSPKRFVAPLAASKSFKPSFNGDGDAAVDGIAGCIDDFDRREPSISTILTSFGNTFDPYGALSTPLYQTSTFMQILIGGNRAFRRYWRVLATLLTRMELSARPCTRHQLSCRREPSISTILTSFGNTFDPYGALSTPLYQTSTFMQPSATEYGMYDYTRTANPTRDVLQSLMAKLEKADGAFCFTSGMAALAAVTHLVETGQEIVAGEDIYGGSDRLLTKVVPNKGIAVKRVDTTNLREVSSAIGPLTKLVWLESPTNPRLQITDMRKISEMARKHGALVLVDNSIMSPVLSQPLEFGADIVMHSATKYISGHSDVMAGVLAVKGKSLAKEIAFIQNAEGNGLAPFDCCLCLRGIKTMALRVEKQQENAEKIAEFLSSHPRVKKVNYPGLPGHPGRSLHYSQAKGAGSVLSFSTGSLALSKHIAETTRHFSITVSFGSVKSLISLPCFMSHASIPASVREARGLTEDLVRISVGIEDVEDLVADLDYAFRSGPV